MMKKLTLTALVLFSLTMFNSCIPILPFGTDWRDKDEVEYKPPVLKGVTVTCDKAAFTLGEFCTLTVTGALDKKYTRTEFEITLCTQGKNYDSQTFTYNDGQPDLWIQTSEIAEKLSSDEQKSISRTIKIKPACTGSFYINFYCSAYNSYTGDYQSFTENCNIKVTE